MDIAKVERVYTNYSGVYDHIFGKIFHESREACVRNLRIRPEENILEVGVGTGIALEYYPKNCNITGIDLSSGMLAKARQRQSHYHLDHVRLMLMDAAMTSPTTASTQSWRRTSSPRCRTIAKSLMK